MGSREDFNADIAAHPFLLGFSEHHVRLLADCATRVAFGAGHVLFREGEAANRFYLIERGEVILETKTPADETVVIDRIGAGDLLGWSWLFAPHLWRFTARASGATTVIFFQGTILREYCEKDHSLGYQLFKRMSAVMTHRLQLARAKFAEEQGAAA